MRKGIIAIMACLWLIPAYAGEVFLGCNLCGGGSVSIVRGAPTTPDLDISRAMDMCTKMLQEGDYRATCTAGDATVDVRRVGKFDGKILSFRQCLSTGLYPGLYKPEDPVSMQRIDECMHEHLWK